MVSPENTAAALHIILSVSYHVRFVSSLTAPRSTASATDANRNRSAIRRGSAAAAVSAGDGEEDKDDDEDDDDEDDDDDDEDDANDDDDADDDCVDDNGLESERAAMDGDDVETAVEGFAYLITDANEMGSADAVRLQPL